MRFLWRIMFWFAAAVGVWFLGLTCTPLAYYYGMPLEERSSPRKSDVIVLLSSGQVNRQWLSPDGSQRTLGALSLYRRGFAPFIISSGSRLDLGNDEAGVQAEWLRLAGVPTEAVVVERASRRTYESAVEVGRIMRERGWKTVVIVTSQLDVPRVRLVFRKMGVDASFLAVPEFGRPRGFLWVASGYPFLYHATYEYAALALYKLRGWI